MVFIYPKTIQTSTGRSSKYGTQQLSNPQALCSDDTNLAYWGVKNPTWMGNYMRNWPDSLTSYSGSYNKPEAIYATGFTLDTVSQNAKLKGITVEYKWEEISYSCGSSDCYGSFQKPNISVLYNDTVLTTIQGAAPDRYRYNNNKVNQSKINTNNAELATLHSHSINLASYNLTIGDLKNIKIKFNGAPNTSTNHLRIVMQFLRIKLSDNDYKINPLCRIKSKLNKIETVTNEPFEYSLSLSSSNKQFDTTKCQIHVPADVEISSTKYSKNSNFDIRTGIWTVNSLTDNNETITLTCKSNQLGVKNISSKILNNADSIDNTTSDNIEVISKNIAFDLKVNQRLFKAHLNSTLSISISLVRSSKTKQKEKIIIDTDGLITDTVGRWTSNIEELSLQHIGDGKWEINDINFSNSSGPFVLDLYGNVEMNKIGDYTITASHQETNTPEKILSEDISVIGNPLSKEYFKLRVEDGTDIQYNSLTFTEGDDLVNPLTYEIEDDNTLLDNLIITGERRKLPVGEAKYIKFTLKLDTDKEMVFKNILANIQASNGQELVDIVLGGDDGITFFESSNHKKYFVIDEINSQEEKTINFIVQSDIEQTCDLKIIIFNEDKYEEPNTRWKPARAIFANIPSIKLSIEGTSSDLTINDTNNGEFTLYYIVENQSGIYTGKDLKFKIEEPIEFKRLSYDTFGNGSTFNTNTRVWKFDKLDSSTKYKLAIKYQATRKGIYKFILKTLDKKNDDEDDQYYNEFIYNMMINIENITDIQTSVSNSHPYYKELIDFNINVKNYIKKQNNFTFEISDIGQYDLSYDTKGYNIEYFKNEYGTFTPNKEENNILGIWQIDEIDINKEYNLTLTLKPIDVGTHVIHTDFIYNGATQQKFDNKVTIFESNHKVNFDVSHAVYDGDEDCPSCNDLIPICDEDFINLKDDIYYLFDITNNENNTLNNLIVYARIPNELLQIQKSNENIIHNIACYPNNDNVYMTIDANTGLLYFNIKQIKPCEQQTFCIKISPNEQGFIPGEYISYFGLTMRNARVKTKQLFLTVDNTYTEKKLEHEITIYNFEKTHRYFRYEIDGTGNLFKFFNKGDRSLRTIDMEDNNVNALETYRGTNLKQIYRDIKNHSKYVEPELLRIGSNAFEDRGYELYPDGFMRRFGLLNSEIYHYTGQLPQSTNLVDYAMKWDVDSWDTKVWAGGLYQNGVFDISVDYSKVPTNFNILDPATNPIKTLQSLVDKTKPFGTKGIAYYSNTTELDLNVDFDINNFTTNSYNYFDLEIEPIFGLVSWYNRHDNSVAIYNDLTQYKLDTDADIITNCNSNNNDISLKTDVAYSSIQYDTIYHKKNIKECTDIIQQIYNKNNNTYGISVTKPKTNKYVEINNIIFNQNIELLYNINSNESITLKNKDTKIILQCVNDEINNFNGFKCYINNELFNQINFDEKIYNSSIRIEYVQDINNVKVFHFWCQINNKDFYHLGYYIGNINEINATNQIYRITEVQPISFKINDTDNLYEATHKKIYSLGQTHKWNYLQNINRDDDKYAYFKNDIEVDKECHNRYLDIPKLILKYNKPNLKNTDEITDISIQIDAHTNKENFKEDININLFKNGDYYLPDENRISDITYPSTIKNIHNIDTVPKLRLQIKGFTICSDCLHTTLGYYDECPYCHSDKTTHFKEQQEATMCYNCGWVHNGWIDRCNHCLSKDIERIMIDVNQTYCTDCKTYSDDYYLACPQCFSDKIIHMHDNDILIDVLHEDTQNIDPIKIQSNAKRINILNIEVPLDNISKYDKIEQMLMTFDISNYNEGKYYYCESCNDSGVGNYDKCPFCNSEEVHNYTDEDIELQCYIKHGNNISKIYLNEGGKISYGNNNKTIDLLDCIDDSGNSSFTLIVYVDNVNYNTQYDEIDKLPIKENDKEKLLNTQIGNNNTNILEFKDFNFKDTKDISNAYLYINGLNQSNSTVDLEIKIIDKNKETHTKTITNINDSLFNEKISLSDIIPLYLLKNINVQLRFRNIQNSNQISIYDLYIMTQKNRSNNIYHSTHKENITVLNDGDKYLFKNNNLWQLNNDIPYYLDGNQLNNGLLCYIDFGKLNTEEYIRIYDIKMLITYQNKKGKFITDYFPVSFDKNEKMISGNIVSNSSNISIETKSRIMDLSNLEYDIFNNTHDEKTLSAMPLNNKIYQSFVAQNNDITQIDLQYFGRIGYPSNNIVLKLYDSYNNAPNNLIAEYNVVIDKKVKQIIAFEIDAALNVGEQYWMLLEDKSADDNNYHRFRYNKNTYNGILMTAKNDVIKKEENYSLSYATYSSVNISKDYNLPTSFAIDDKKEEWYSYQFKNYYTLYRNNINPNSNLYLTDLYVKYGYEQEWE